MKNFVLSNKRVLLLILFVFMVIISFNIFNKKEKNKSSNIYEFSTIRNGDIIPFNSRIQGKFNLYIKFESLDKQTIHYITSKFIKANHNNVYYCKSKKCLENYKYDYVRNLYNVGDNIYYDFNVSNYKDIFNRESNYTGWEIHYIPFEYYNENFHTMFIGTYYDIVLVPTNETKNKCLDNIKEYGISNNFEVINHSDTWKIDNNNFYLYENSKGYIEIKFSAKKGSKILFDINTTSDTLELYLNDKDISSILNLWRNDSYFRYNSNTINIDSDGTYILRIEDNKVKENETDMFDKIVNIKNFTIFTPRKKEDANIYYTKCDFDTIIGEVNE